MRQGSITIGFIIIFVSVIIFLIKNQEIVKKLFNRIVNTKFKYIFHFIIIILGFIFLYNNFIEIVEDIRIYLKNKEFNKIYEYSDNKKLEENKYYKEVINKIYENENYKKPYIPENFNYVEGTYVDGFVIEDKNENQYVWIPCTNKDIEGIPKLQKKNFVSPAFISKDVCYDDNYEEFLKSALENGGFYISRFEIGKENNVPVSKANMIVWDNVTREQAKNIIANMYTEENIKCELINGFAYDTTLQWLKNSNKLEKNVIDILKIKNIYTGRKSYNRIYDFCDNILELSTETFYDNIIVRGFSASEEDYNIEVQFSDESRYSIFNNDTSVSLLDGLSFRTVLYK